VPSPRRWGKKQREKEALAGFFLLIGGGERGGGGILVLPVGDSPPTAHVEWLDLGACWVPRAGVANRWTLVGVFKSGVSLVCTRAALFMGLAR
jgi:hypothetical protein